jgi:hypothetical protein
MRLHTPVQWGGLTLLLSVSVTGSSTQTEDEFYCGSRLSLWDSIRATAVIACTRARQSIGMHITEVLQ